MRQICDDTIVEDVPWSEHITEYDIAHLALYLRVLDANAAQALVEDIAEIILKIDARGQSERACKAVDSHLRRALRMTETGYRGLLAQELPYEPQL